jgi:hypothetical protein
MIAAPIGFRNKQRQAQSTKNTDKYIIAALSGTFYPFSNNKVDAKDFFISNNTPKYMSKR